MIFKISFNFKGGENLVNELANNECNNYIYEIYCETVRIYFLKIHLYFCFLILNNLFLECTHQKISQNSKIFNAH